LEPATATTTSTTVERAGDSHDQNNEHADESEEQHAWLRRRSGRSAADPYQDGDEADRTRPP
jgi:hypothetical protein